MIQKLKKEIASRVYSVVISLIPSVSQECQIIWYQEKEPADLEEFYYQKKLTKR